ncbi:MAG: aerobic carbon-monoxide dehydrogenase medium subunit [Chloroflexota bacterium]|jgi:carbon-monoxide dehydrogenase medium subunit|nr:aerobic carbon-monoxide dehydrogenase medium subunit [Chloroflexota bacterium]
MTPASFAYFAPQSLKDVFELLDEHGDDAKLLAGGHSLIPAMKLRLAQPPVLIDLAHVPELRGGIRLDGDTLVIGAMTVHADVAASEIVRQRLPGLAYAAERIGDVQVRNRGTIGGSIAHADPAADFPVILTALDASFTLATASDVRTIPAEAFFVDYFTTTLAPNEVLTEIRVPLPPAAAGTAYEKLGNPASGFVEVSAGVLLIRGSDGTCTSARVAVGGLAGAPTRARATEAALVGQPLTPETIAAAAALAAEGTQPDGDLYANAEYKRHVAGVYTRRALETAAQRAGDV